MSTNIRVLLILSLTAPLALAEQPTFETPSHMPYPERVFGSSPKEQVNDSYANMLWWELHGLKHQREECQEAGKRDIAVLLGLLPTAACVAERYNTSDIANHIVNTVGTHSLMIFAGCCLIWAAVCELNRQNHNNGKMACEAEYAKDEKNYLFLKNKTQEAQTR